MGQFPIVEWCKMKPVQLEIKNKEKIKWTCIKHLSRNESCVSSLKIIPMSLI